MRKQLNRFKNEKGALSFEFLGIIPFFFLLLLILWQVVASGYAIYTVKTAANEGAKTFAATRNVNETENRVIDVIGTSSVITYEDMDVVYLTSQGKFELNVRVKHPLVFVPSIWKTQTSLPLEESIISQVLVQ